MSTILARVSLHYLAIVHRLYDNIVAPLWLRQMGLEMGAECKFYGMPYVRVVPGSNIRLGNTVRIYSRASGNSRGVPHPTYLWTQEAGAQLIIDDNVSMTAVSISCRSTITVGRYVQIGPGACLWDSDGHPLQPMVRRNPTSKNMNRRSPITIGDDCFIGARAIILKGTILGEGCIVGAGAVVSGTFPPYSVLVGNPAKVIKTIEVNQE